jgi:hypothetical protein
MPVFEIGLEDGRTLQIEADDQQAALAGVEHFQQKETPSGALAGAKHGVAQVAHGIAETAKQNFGLGNGFDSRDPNYVPADPYKPSQWGQLIAENVPSMGGAIAGGKAAAAMAPGRLKIPAALAGAMGAGWLMSSGDTIKERAANNGRDEPNLQDKVVGNLTAGAASAASAVPAARLVPGLNTVAGAGGKAVAGALLKAGTTLGSGIAGGAASDLATQVGTTAGTDQGLTVDPSRIGGAAITGGVTSGAMAGAPLAGDLVRAGTLRKFAGANEAASKNYATRLEDAGNGSLGNAKVDEAAHQRVLGDLKSELGASAANVRKQASLSQEAENTLSALQRGEKVNPDEIARIERETASAPDGANTALLARTLHVADMAGERGGHSNRGWAGGMSGVMDKNLGFMLNPARLAGGAAATALGMHLLGTSNPLFGASLAGAYGATRIVDNLTGMRSPGKTFADHFADRNAQLRVPPNNTPPSAPPPPPGGQAQGPWGPKPLAQQSVPQAGQQPPQPQMPLTPGTLPWKAPQVAQLPNINPVAASMLQQKLKAGLPAEPQAAPAPAAQEPPAIDPLNLPTSITKSAKNLMGGHKAVQEIRQQEQARDAVSRLPSPAVEGAPLDVTQNPMVGKRASQLVSAANALRKYTGADVAEREQAQAEAQAAREEKAAAKEQVRAQRDAEHKAEREKTATERAQAMAERAQVKAAAAAAKAEQVKQKEEAKAELAKAKEAAKVENDKVKAAAAKVRATKVVSEQPKAAAPKAEAPKADAPYEPIPDDLLTRRHKTDEQVAASEVSDYEPGLQKKYAKNIMFRRSTLRNRLEEVASDANDVDSSAIGRLYHQMDHSHSQREVQRHLAHWTAKMDPATKQAIHAAVAPLLKLWKE